MTHLNISVDTMRRILQVSWGQFGKHTLSAMILLLSTQIQANTLMQYIATGADLSALNSRGCTTTNPSSAESVKENTSLLYSLAEKPLFSTPSASGTVQGKLLPASDVLVIACDKEMLKVQFTGWIEKSGKGDVLSQQMGNRTFTATIQGDIKNKKKVLDEKVDHNTKVAWQYVSVQAWVTKDNLAKSIQPIWRFSTDSTT